MAIFFTSDTHFGHANIIGYSRRPFATVEEMDSTILDNINAVVRPQDTLYHLGDFCWRDTSAASYRSRINCRNVHLILGNHDPQTRGGDVIPAFAALFSSVHTLRGINVQVGEDSQHIVLCHYAMSVWNKFHHGSWHLYGHSHGDHHSPPFHASFDVGVDPHHFHPLSLHQVASLMAARSPSANPHHTS